MVDLRLLRKPRGEVHMKKFICALVSILSFVALTGFVGGLECGNITISQFILSSTFTFLLMVSSALIGGLEQ